MSRVCLYFIRPPETDRWLRGDRHLRPFIRRLIRGRRRPSGIERVFLNLCLGLDRLGVPYVVNLPFRDLQAGDRIGILGQGRHCLDGY
ncbi:MAG: glycosyltransferase family 1 protein, partial [Magnetococcales bacterium]|nr:glycosyltransferase family 1 protein [Magnetococcales bacterium]